MSTTGSFRRTIRLHFFHKSMTAPWNSDLYLAISKINQTRGSLSWAYTTKLDACASGKHFLCINWSGYALLVRSSRKRSTRRQYCSLHKASLPFLILSLAASRPSCQVSYKLQPYALSLSEGPRRQQHRVLWAGFPDLDKLVAQDFFGIRIYRIHFITHISDLYTLDNHIFEGHG